MAPTPGPISTTSRGSPANTRCLRARRFHSMYGSITRKNAALKRPRSACCSNPVSGGTVVAVVDHVGSRVSSVVDRHQRADHARSFRRGTTSLRRHRLVPLSDVPRGDLGSRSEAEAQADPFDMTLGGPFVDAQSRGDLAVRAPFADQRGDLGLAGRQRSRAARQPCASRGTGGSAPRQLCASPAYGRCERPGSTTSSAPRDAVGERCGLRRRVRPGLGHDAPPASGREPARAGR